MKKSGALTLLLICSSLNAQQDALWQCTTYDDTGKPWVIRSEYSRMAMNKAFDACKKESTIPASCKTSAQDCEVFVNGLSTRPMWRCTALDRSGAPWISNAYQNRDDAALAARAYCKEQSSIPETCYMNTITCQNRNDN